MLETEQDAHGLAASQAREKLQVVIVWRNFKMLLYRHLTNVDTS